MTRERWMALSFALGSLCFLIAPIGIYARLVGGAADSATFFAGSIPFTIGGAIQTASAWADRRSATAGWALLRAAAIQSVGTVFFNITTERSLSLVAANPHYDRLVWRPDAYGSVCFLISGVITYLAAPRRGWRLRRIGAGWWEPGVNLLGCILFGISAIGAFSLRSSGSLIGPRLDTWGTGLGAACFELCALATLRSGLTIKSPRLRRWERDADEELTQVLSGG